MISKRFQSIKLNGDLLRKKSVIEMTTIFSLSCLAYANVVSAPFLHDDNPAILNNPDVQGNSKISRLWCNDFWGTPIRSKFSHKSYRPITILCFRLIHAFCGNCSTIYHVINIILHSAISILFFLFCRKNVFPSSATSAPFLSGLLFGLHPIHTEAVCGIVGCAELLSAFCFMLTLLFYDFSPEKSDGKKLEEDVSNYFQRKTKNSTTNILKREPETLRCRKQHGPGPYLFSGAKTNDLNSKTPNSHSILPSYIKISLASSLVAMLCKESGITVLGVIFVLDLLIKSEHNNKSFKKNLQNLFIGKRFFKFFLLILWGVLLLLFRMWVMGWTYPVFSKSDNPLIYEKALKIRFLSCIYIYWYNFSLLLFPVQLCYDYSFSTIPLVGSLWDPRNITSVTFFILLIGQGTFLLLINIKRVMNDWERTFLIGYVLMIVPFLPASNIFFPVGFVIAERVLYLPSLGFIIMVVLTWSTVLKTFPSLKFILKLLMLGMLVFYFIQTMDRSKDWTSKERLLWSGVKVAPKNPKMRYNWANYLRDSKKYQEAIQEYTEVLTLEPFYVSAINNLGTVLEEIESSTIKAEELYARAIQIQPRHENAYSNLAKILIKQHRYQEATKVLLKAIKNVPGHLIHATSLAEVLMQRNKLEEAERVFGYLLNRSCLVKLSNNYLALNKSCPQVYFSALRSYSKLLLRKGETKKSLYLLNEVVDRNFSDTKSQVIWGQALIAYGDITEATKVFLRISQQSEEHVADLWIAASELHRKKYFEESKQLYEVFLQKKPNNLEALGQYAGLLFEMGKQKKGERILQEILENDRNCEIYEVWRNLATMYGRQKKHEEAISFLSSCFLKQNNLDGDDNKAKDKKKAAILCELSKHKRDRSKQLNQTQLQKASKLWKEAITDLEEALQLDSTNAEAKTMMKTMKQT